MRLGAERACVCCPPGQLGPSNGVTHVIVAAPMRSGTHLVIDFLLNNFPAYRHNPLYVNYERFNLAGIDSKALLDRRGAVVKTHYPHAADRSEWRELLEELARRCPVITPRRDPAAVAEALSRFGRWGAEQDAERVRAEFEAFWRDVPKLELDFRDLIDPNAVERVVRAIAEHLGRPMPRRCVGPRPLRQRRRILVDKALTRLVGAHAPRVNTTIGLGRVARP